MPPAVVTVKTGALRRWLHQSHGTWLGQQWKPTAEGVADLVEELNDDLANPDGLARAGWTMPRAIRIFAQILNDGDVVFGADIAGGGRIASLPQSDKQLRDSRNRIGVDAAVEALLYLAHLINEAYPAPDHPTEPAP